MRLFCCLMETMEAPLLLPTMKGAGAASFIALGEDERSQFFAEVECLSLLILSLPTVYDMKVAGAMFRPLPSRP